MEMTYRVNVYYLEYERTCVSKLINVKDIVISDRMISFVHENDSQSVFNKSVVIYYTIMEEAK